MTNRRHVITLTIGLTAMIALCGCDQSKTPGAATPQPKDQSTPTATAATPAPATPVPARPQHVPVAPQARVSPTDAVLDGPTLKLTGISLTVPPGWVARPTPSGPMAAKAVFALPHADESSEDGGVRITYFPSMKGKDEMNIDRWVRQARHADGTPFARTDAKIEREEFGNVRLTTVDISGTIQATMRAAPKPGSRMIAAIIDHPSGPHFVSIVGDEKTMAHWETAIRSFLHSAKVE